jgi:hypothetical protein
MDQRSRLDKAKDQNLGEIKKIDSKVEKCGSDIKVVTQTLAKLMQENPWVRAEKDMFGSPDSTEYKNIRNLDIPKTRLLYHRLIDENEQLKKQVNVHVNAMAEKAETDYDALIKKRDKVLADKGQI